MNQIKQSVEQKIDMTPAKYWGTLVLDILAMVTLGGILRTTAQLPEKIVTNVAMVMLVLALMAGVLIIVLTLRGRQPLAAQIVFFVSAVAFGTTIIIYSGRIYTTISSLLLLSTIIISQILPKTKRRTYIGITAVIVLLLTAVELISPSWRITTEAEQFGTFSAVAFGLTLAIILVSLIRQAWSGNIRVKVVTSFTVMALISVAIVGTVVYISYRNQVRADIRQRLLNIVTITAMRLDGDLHATLQTPQDMQTEAYRQMMAEGDEIIATDPELIFSYTMRLNEQGQIYFVIDSRRADDTEREPIGKIYDEPSETLRAFFNAPDHPIVEEEIYTDQYGSVLSAFAPFYRADGSLEGIFGIDIAADAVLEQERNVLYLILGTTFGTMFLVTLLGLFLGNLFVVPVINLSAVAKKITEGDLSARAKIETTDEVGDLAQAFNAMTSQLQGTLQGLERRVAERTRNLELAGEVGRTVSQVRALDIMLKEAAELIRSQFDLYYVQVYLTDPSQTNLILQSGTGAVGAELLGRGHRLPLNTASINGRAAIEKRSIVVEDTAASAAFKPNPLLPDTRSEMAVPLLIGEKVVGVLDLQSGQANALNQDTLTAFEALAGQLAIAIQNAAFLAETQQARAEVEAQARRLTRANWADYMDAIHQPEETGFVFEQNKVAPLTGEEPVKDNALVAPITVTGEALGNLIVEMEGGSPIARTEELVNTVAQQVARQIESLRLLDSAERYRFEAEQASRRLTREGWQDYTDANADKGLSYIYDLKEVRTYNQIEDQQTEESAFNLPLKVRDETVGRLVVQGLTSDDTESLELANAVAERLGAHIESLRQFDQTQSALAQSEKLFEASRVLTQASDLQELLASTVKMLDISEINRATMVTFGYDKDNQLEGMDVIANWWSGTGREVTPIGTHYSQEAYRDMPLFLSPVPLFFENVLTDERSTPEMKVLATKLGLSAIADLPLHIGAHQIGALMLEAETPHHFSNEETRLFSALAPQIATVLENRRQFQQAQHQAERESTLNLISQKIQSATTVEAVLQIAARELGHALGAPMTIAQLGMKEHGNEGK